MKIHHLRCATFVIESGANFILVDPMLSEKGKLSSFTVVRHKYRRNPTVSLPDNSTQVLDKVTHCLVTHCQKGHLDHLDHRGKSFLRENNTPVVCHEQDSAFLRKRGINVEMTLDYWQTLSFLDGEITAVPAKHGLGWIRYFMENGSGFHIQLPGEPSIYISGDTVFTNDIERALIELKPDIAVVAAGNASLDVGGPILMSLEEIISFVRTAPDKVIANHLEALNHCPLTRVQLKQALKDGGLLSKTFIPDDGETLNL